jgi:crotonobetainyl-CoA:carnitine CoA-transferase CaiB-like acyl-CoA transferase
MYEILSQAMPERTTEEWLTTFERLDVPHSRVSTLEDLLTDPHLQAVGFFDATDDTPGRVRSVPQPVRVRGAGVAPDRRAPLLGENSLQLLGELGYDDHEAQELISRGVVRVSIKAEEA